MRLLCHCECKVEITFSQKVVFFSLKTGLKTFHTKNDDFIQKGVFHMFCSRMSIFRVFNVKNHSVESGFFADFERFWMSKNDKLDLQILGQIPTES